MGKILEAFHTSSGASEEICENIRDKPNGEYGTHLFSTKKPEGSPQPTYPT